MIRRVFRHARIPFSTTAKHRDSSALALSRLKRLGAVSVALVVALVGGSVLAGPAFAATASLSVDKSVDGKAAVAVTNGSEFTYTVMVGCDDNDCLDAKLVDALPAEFAGFSILDTSVSPSSKPFTKSLTGCTNTVTSSCVLTVLFTEQVAGGVGIPAGGTYRVTVTLKAPQNLAPDWAYNGVKVTNTALGTSSTAPDDSGSADVTVSIPVSVDEKVGKTWAPANQQFAPGATSTVTLTSQNTSNVPAATLSVQDPTVAQDGAASLDAANPFAIVDFAGFGAVTLPAGADLVQVDAYVYDSGSHAWKWQTGPPTAVADIQLPSGVAAANVGGLRFTYSSSTGTTLAANGAAGSVAVSVAQRAVNRSTAASLVGGATVTNKVTGIVTVPGKPPVSKTAQAPFTVGGLTVLVSAGKTIAPSRIPAGTTATATITGKNDSNGPLSTLTLGDRDFFTASLGFGGFAAPLSYPSGATGASVVWIFSDGSSVSAPFADGATPVAPAAPTGAHLTGFELAYTGAVAVGAIGSAQFLIAPAADYVAQNDSPADVTNTVTVTGINPAGTANRTATAPLKVFFPEISLKLSKSIAPSGAVSPGSTVVAKLPATTSTDSAYVRPNTIVVEDTWRSGRADDFFNAFNPIAIAPTQVPLGSTLTVEYSTDGGATYSVFTVVDATTAATNYSAALPAGLVGSITGLRFTFANPAGFGQGTTVSPNITAQARAALRDGSGSTSVANGPKSTYQNLASSHASGVIAGAPPVVSPVLTATATAAIQSQSGSGSLGTAKKWTKPDLTGDLTELPSQSGQQAGTVLSWGVTDTGYSSVTISDPASNEADPAQTVFQAFDLVSIAAVSFASQPLLKWDAVSEIRLYHDGAWNLVPAPGGTWMNGTGFKGYALTPAELSGTTGVRITVIPNDPARATATDPAAPPAGSGIATVAFGQSRSFGLVWQLRNLLRDPAAANDPFASADTLFNDSTAGTIWNRSSASGVHNGTPVGPVDAADNLALIDQPPLVDVAKTSQRSTMVVPKAGDVDPSAYPTNDFTITAKNAAAARASYIRVTDPSPCDSASMGACLSAANAWSADPFAGASYSTANPFERLTLTRIRFTAPSAQVDPVASQVTLWHRASDGTLGTTRVSMTQAAGLQPADLLDVVGVSVVYQGTNPVTGGGTIVSGQNLVMTLSTQVRVTQRSDASAEVKAFRVDNAAFAQGYDPVLYPSGQGSQPNDSDTTSLTLTTATLDVTAAKSFSTPSVLEKDRHTPVAVTLTATQGQATAATHQVTLTDTDSGFWNRFALTGLSAGDVTLPAGADRVRVDVQTGGTSTWIAGTTAATASLPTTALDQITGIRFVFSRADGDLFSRTAVPANFTATAILHVQLRDASVDGSPTVFPSTVDDTVTALTHRTDNPAVYADRTADATASIALLTGTHSLDVSKTPENGIHTVSVGDPGGWTLTFANTGTGFVDVTKLVDTLPASLAWDGEAPTFATTPGGTLSVTPATGFDTATRELTLSWPAGGARMSPGERFTVQLNLVLQPGLTGSQQAVNSFSVTTAQTLDACTNTSGNGQGTLSGLAANACGTSNYVQPISGPSLYTSKGVKGDVVGGIVSGAVNPSSPSATCTPDADGYFVSPCAANTVVGGTDQWRLRAINSGTVTYDALVFVEPLPTPGDRMLATGAARGSTYRPVFDQDYGLVADAPAGTTMTWEVTTAPDVCVGAGATAWPSDPTCSTNPVASEWVPSTAFTGDWSAVTGLRVTLDFTTTAAGTLAPGATVGATYRTVNRPATVAAPDGAPVSMASAPSFAWNQFGATAALTGGGTVRRAPVKAGVTIVTGPLQVDKIVTGSAASSAPAQFLADVACTVAGAPVDLGAAAQLTLATATGLTARIDGIPLGADCTVAEQGAAGSYGEADRSIAGGTVHVLSAEQAGAVPAAQTATITNTYEFGALSIAKTAKALSVMEKDAVEYTITVTNQGALDATAFTVTDTLPKGSTFVSADHGGTEGNGVVSWAIPLLAKGASIDVHVTLTFAAAGTYANIATVSTPPVGPWKPPTTGGTCSGLPDAACSQVVVNKPVDPAGPSEPTGPVVTPTPTPKPTTTPEPMFTSVPAPAPSTTAGGLAATGSAGDYLLVAGWGALLLLIGAAFVSRRRRGQA
ncbi:DUF5979 domain-containing protein [Leifsonia sp. PS1209]|uniref:DUF5979 domain-containing protein n=1 Tax=Leifsonia sp. PS1209 TaxID=2724914 RepID=UPI001442A45E|nr:DUF5979 domain-containing protein [Leifsonia sp. PS1209]QIZ99710.1 DUF11 domain-containing protein [Leifsonia sp. PS1209]